MGIRSYTEREIGNLSFGQLGFDEISNTSKSPSSGEVYVALYVDVDATFSATSTVGDNLSSQFRTAGRVIYGSFSSVTVTDSGVVLAYKAPKVG